MNKAFVREPEPAEPRCPAHEGCDGIGTPVTRMTLLAHLPEDNAQSFAESSYYCGNPNCQIVYFDAWGTTVLKTALRSLAYPKSPTAPVCPCFGITAQEIREDGGGGKLPTTRLGRGAPNAPGVPADPVVGPCT